MLTFENLLYIIKYKGDNDEYDYRYNIKRKKQNRVYAGQIQENDG